MHPRLRPSLRFLFALTIAALSLLATLAVALLAGRETSLRLGREIGEDLAELAQHMADTLDRGVFERWRDIQVAASLDTMRDPAVAAEKKQAVLDRLRQTYPDYAAIGFMTPDGRVAAATIPALVGANAAKRAFFVEGAKRPFAGDVHDAILLAKLLGNDAADPPRFVDLAAPVQAEDGSLVGVIGAHLYWTWAEEMQAALRSAARARHPTIDVLVLARDGTVLLGPKALLGAIPALASVASVREGGSGSAVEAWAEGRTYLSGYHPTRGYRDYPGLGWSVLVREPADISFAPVGAVQRRIALWGGLVALAAALLAWLAAGLVVRPLGTLAASARRLGQGEPLPPLKGATREIEEVGGALASAATELALRERRQALLIAELNHRVKNTLATVQAMARITARSARDAESYKDALETRIIALSKTHNLLTEASWETIEIRDILRNELEPYDGGPDRRIALDGPAVPLRPRVAVALGMAVHELATNAAKHGSLSVPHGRLAVRWSLHADAEGPSRLRLDWTESGGPDVAEPTHRGFGSRLLHQGLSRDLDGEMHLDFAVAGVSCTMLIGLDDVSASDAAESMVRGVRAAA